MEELARRDYLETQLPILETELTRRYMRQKVNLNRVTWLAVLLAIGIGFTMLIDRLLRNRKIALIRDRFAADLHDELGANIHTIGLLSDLAKDAIDSPEELTELLDRMRVFTERCGDAVRYCTNMLDPANICEDLVGEMKRSSERLLADLEHEIFFDGDDILNNLKPRKRIDLFLFYKECLTNIIRHSGATKAVTTLIATPKAITLSISDNGHGIVQRASNDSIPPSLKRRARLLRAKVTLAHPAEGGTRITLLLRSRRG
jgi:signal transduction histidine kinase